MASFLELVRELGILFGAVFVVAALLVSVGMFAKAIGRNDLRLRSPFAGLPFEGPAIQARRCMDWQDCSFYVRGRNER